MLSDEEKKAIDMNLTEIVNKVIECKYRDKEITMYQYIVKKEKEKIECIYNYLEQFKNDMETGGIDIRYCLKILKEE